MFPRKIEPEIVSSARRCIDSCFSLCLSYEGVGGTYFIKDENDAPIAVFKPVDEEPGGINNPKCVMDVTLLPAGGGFKREIAAWLLDHNNHARVPETHLFENVYHPSFNSSDGNVLKCGSIQKYIKNIGNAESMSSSRFLVSDVHNIGILDIRLFNMDRNLENILVTIENGIYRLIPIDHSYTLPSKLDGASFDWLYWSQSKKPFSLETLEYIFNLDMKRDEEILRMLEIGDEGIKTMKISTIWLKELSREGLNLFEIAERMCRKVNGEKSFLEDLVLRAEKMCDEEESFFIVFERLVKKEVVNLNKDKMVSKVSENVNCLVNNFTGRSG